VWLRVPGDVVFAVGTLFLALFVLRVMRRPARPVEVPIDIGDRGFQFLPKHLLLRCRGVCHILGKHRRTKKGNGQIAQSHDLLSRRL